MATHIITRSENTSTVTSTTLGKGSALSHQELDSNFINLRDDKLDNVTDTFTGTLTVAGSGSSAVGELKFNDNDDSNSVTIKALGTIGSNYTLTLPPNDGTSGQVLTTDGSGVLTFTDKTVDTTNVVSDTSPQLGGDLDVNGQEIVTTSNGHIELTPNGTGQIRVDSNVIEQHSAAGIVINHRGQGTHNGANFGAPEGDSSGSTMLFNTGIQIEGRGAHEFPAVVLRNTSDATRYNNLWAAKARPSSGDYTTDTFIQEDDIIFKFFGAGFQGTDGQGNSVFNNASASVDMYATENHSASTNGGGLRIQTLNTGTDAASGAETTKIDVTDSVKILNPKAATTAALSVEGSIRLKNTSNPSNVTDSAHIFAKDDGSTSEVYVRDEAGNETKISPHNQSGEWEYLSRNVNTGKVVRINMEEMIRDIEKLTGKTYIENK